MSSSATFAKTRQRERVARRKYQLAVAKRAHAIAVARAKPRYEALHPTNFVCTCETFRPTDLKQMAMVLHGRHKQRAFPSNTIHIRNPRVTMSVFSEGRIVTTGAKTENLAMEAVMNTLAQFTSIKRQTSVAAHKDKARAPEPIRLYNWKLQNVVGAGGFGVPIDIESFAADHIGLCQLEFKSFPGCRCSVPGTRRMKMVVFHSGMYLVTGGSCEDDLYKAFDTMRAKLRDYIEGGSKYKDTTAKRLNDKLDKWKNARRAAAAAR